MPLSKRQHKILNTGRQLVEKFLSDRCTIQASALSFSSMLSIVPFLAFLFSILKALDVHTTPWSRCCYPMLPAALRRS
jgi:membrane protein